MTVECAEGELWSAQANHIPEKRLDQRNGQLTKMRVAEVKGEA